MTIFLNIDIICKRDMIYITLFENVHFVDTAFDHSCSLQVQYNFGNPKFGGNYRLTNRGHRVLWIFVISIFKLPKLFCMCKHVLQFLSCC